MSQSDRSSDGFGIANGSQTIAVTAAATEAEDRTLISWSPNTTSSSYVPANDRDGLVNLR